MSDATLYILVVGSILVAIGIVSLYFSSDSAQQKFNPDGETKFGSNSRRKRIIVEKDYRVRPK